MSELSEHPPFSGTERMGFAYARDNENPQVPIFPETPWTDPSSAPNTVQVSNSLNIFQTIASITYPYFPFPHGIFFDSIVSQDIGSGDPTFPYSKGWVAEYDPASPFGSPYGSIPVGASVGPYDSDAPPPFLNGVPVVKMKLSAETNFWYKVSQEANGGQAHSGVSMKYKAKVLKQTFSATYGDSFSDNRWIWTTSGATSEDAEVTVTAQSVDWNNYENHVAEIKSDTKHGPIDLYDGTFNYELRYGWIDEGSPPSQRKLYWYAKDASVTIRQYLKTDATLPQYEEPVDYNLFPGGTQRQYNFSPIQLSPPLKAYS